MHQQSWMQIKDKGCFKMPLGIHLPQSNVSLQASPSNPDPEKYVKAKLNMPNPTAPIPNVYNVVESFDVLVCLFICLMLGS